MLQGTFLVFSVAVIVANLVADCLYFVLDPRVQARERRASSACCSATKRGRARRSIVLGAVRRSWRSSASALAPYDPLRVEPDVLGRRRARRTWLGTTEQGSDVLSQLMVGARVSIVVGFAAALISAVLGAAVGLIGGYFGGWTDRVLRRVRELVPGDPDAAADGRARAAAEPVAGRADPGDRADELGGHGADRALAGADAEGARVRRAGAGAGRERRLHHPHPHPPQHAAADLRQHRADRGGGDPRPRRRWRSSASATRRSISWGTMLDERLRRPARRARARGGTSCRPGSASPLLVLAVAMLGYLFEEYVNPRLREQR